MESFAAFFLILLCSLYIQKVLQIKWQGKHAPWYLSRAYKLTQLYHEHESSTTMSHSRLESFSWFYELPASIDSSSIVASHVTYKLWRGRMTYLIANNITFSVQSASVFIQDLVIMLNLLDNFIKLSNIIKSYELKPTS